MGKSRKHKSSSFLALDKRLRHIQGLHCLDTAMIKFLGESRGINFCLCTARVSCTAMQCSSTFFVVVHPLGWNFVSTSTWLCVISNMKCSSYQTRQTSLIFETSPNEKPKEKKVGDMAYYIQTVWKSGHVSRVPHLITPMSVNISWHK